jgi:hypothetical protein
MTIDKTVWREALAHYRVWNEDVFMDRVLRAGEQTPAEIMTGLSGAHVLWLENQTYTKCMATAADHGGLGGLPRPHQKV